MTAESSTLEALAARITLLEDREKILNLLAGLAQSSDVADLRFQSRAYHDNCFMDGDNAAEPIVGRKAIIDIIGSERHTQAIDAGMVHFAGLPHVRIDGCRAVVTGYLQIVVPIDDRQRPSLGGYGETDGLAIWRLTANRWELAKDSRGWSVVRRTIRSVPASDYRQLIALGLA